MIQVKFRDIVFWSKNKDRKNDTAIFRCKNDEKGVRIAYGG